MAESFKIAGTGGEATLSGSIVVSGAKNAVLPAMAASLLVEGTVMLQNVPHIEDVSRMCELLADLGVRTVREGSDLSAEVGAVDGALLRPDVARRLRASVFLSGPLLARCGEVVMPHPGGDVIGARPIDLFLAGFRKMGATIVVDASEQLYRMHAKGGLQGADIFFPFVSVGATETLMMAATRARGTTTLRNAAVEPEVTFLATLLSTCGAKIAGIGTSTLTIEGVASMRAPSAPITIIPDRIEAGTYAVLGALACTALSIENCNPDHLEAPIELLRSAGVPLEVYPDRIHIARPSCAIESFNVRTHEYPGFATDLQAPMTVLLTQTKGESVVFETIFEGRLGYVEDLIRMGADITPIGNHRALVRGPRMLHGRELEGPDIRAGLAYVLAALIAEGESVVDNIYHIDRGYERVEEKLQALGARIERTHD